jgi:hypothetical protein
MNRTAGTARTRRELVRCVFVNSPRRAEWDNLHHDYFEVDITFIGEQMHAASVLDESSVRWIEAANDGIIAVVVERRFARLDGDEGGTGVRVPATMASRCDRDVRYIDLGKPLGLDLDVIVEFALGLDRLHQ